MWSALLLAFAYGAGFFRYPSTGTKIAPGVQIDDALYLSKYLNNPDQGQTLSRVTGSPVPSHSGYFTVNEKTDSNMFFWYFPCPTNPKAPLLLWLQGGPGGSSLFGLFTEIGPVTVNGQTLEKMAISWNQKYSLLFIDNPVGTGFSYTNNGYAESEDDVARDLYSCLTQFFTIFYQSQPLPFYITGESYAGKYIPSIGYHIHQMNRRGPAVQINLKGVAIGDGLIDPESMMPAYADIVYEFGLCDQKQREVIRGYTDRTVTAIKAKDWMTAFKEFDLVLNGDLCQCTPYVANITGTSNYFNLVEEAFPSPSSDWESWVNLASSRNMLHVGTHNFTDSNTVEEHLILDLMQSVKPAFVGLLENKYKVMLYNGNLDLIVGAPVTELFLSRLAWSGAAEYSRAQRKLWRVKGDPVVAGYVKQVQNLAFVVVRGAGHMVPSDQPQRGLDLISRFVDDIPFE